jgi:hypothetical protein
MVLAAVGAETNRQRAGQERLLFALIADPNILAHSPFTLSFLRCLKSGAFLGSFIKAFSVPLPSL